MRHNLAFINILDENGLLINVPPPFLVQCLIIAMSCSMRFPHHAGHQPSAYFAQEEFYEQDLDLFSNFLCTL